MRSFPRSPRTRGQRFASAVLAAFAAVAVAACEPVPQTTKQSDRGAAERPDPSYGGPARQIRGLERLYRVESGDTMAEIARLYGMDPVAIEEVNGLQQPYQLFVGEFLILPDTGSWGQAESIETVSAHPVEDVEAQPLPELQ